MALLHVSDVRSSKCLLPEPRLKKRMVLVDKRHVARLGLVASVVVGPDDQSDGGNGKLAGCILNACQPVTSERFVWLSW